MCPDIQKMLTPTPYYGRIRFVNAYQYRRQQWRQIDVAFPVGMVTQFSGSAAPSGWLFCDGSVKSRAIFAALFAVVGTTYNTGGESGTSFRLPDYRGRSPIGVGTGSGLTNRVLGANGGEENHTLVTTEAAFNGAQIQNYNVIGDPLIGVSVDSGGILPQQQVVDVGSCGHANTATTPGYDASDSHNTMHPFLVMNSIIKT